MWQPLNHDCTSLDGCEASQTQRLNPKRHGSHQLNTTRISFPLARRKAFVQRTFLGLRRRLKFFRHLDLQKRNTCNSQFSYQALTLLSFLTNTVPWPG